MLHHYVLALFIAVPVSGAPVETTDPPAITGIWQSQRCEVHERNGTQTSSRSVFVFLESEWALAKIRSVSLSFFSGRTKATAERQAGQTIGT